MLSIKDTLRQLFFRVPVIGSRYRDLLTAAESHYRINPGHYASPIPGVDEIQREIRSAAASSLKGDALPGIPLNTQSQLQLLERLRVHLAGFSFPSRSSPTCRYHYLNDWFQFDDAAFYFALLLEYRPKRIIEVGSGFSSALMLDTIDIADDYNPEITLIEPSSERLRDRLQVNDDSRFHLIESLVQNADLTIFDALEENDFLFIDSSHVAKCGSDVNVIIHEILPRLSRGVIVHFHDIFYPFTYPARLLYADQFWNEAYILRAFLANNERFRVMLWNDYLSQMRAREYSAALPVRPENIAGSLWTRAL